MLLNLILSEDRGVVMTSIVIIPVTTIVKSTDKEREEVISFLSFCLLV